jgi:putative ABC transport system ATP-binding protein
VNALGTNDSIAVTSIGLTRIYKRGSEVVRALDNVSFEIRRGEFVAITGPSGAGKTTLLNLIGCMDAPTSGTLRLAEREIQAMAEAERTRVRRREIGFVFQHFGLIPTLTVEENICLPAFFDRRPAVKRAAELLEKVGLAHRRHHRPHELSGGEMQRVALARALVNEPRLILADEPTGNLDSATGDGIIALFHELCGEGLTVVVVTHNPVLTAASKRQLTLRDGKLVASAPS